MAANASTTLDVSEWTPSIPVTPNNRAPKTILESPRDEDPLKVADLLLRLPREYCDVRRDWVRVLAALYNSDPKLEDLARSWSKRSTKYDKDEFDRVWDSLAGGPRHGGTPCTLGTLYHIVNVTTESENPFEANYYGEADLESADFKVDFLVDGMVIEGQNGLFVGQEKTLKTTLSHAMGIGLAHGLPFMGRNVEQRVTALFSGESGDATTQETNKRIRESLGVKPDNEAFIYCPTLPYFDAPMTHFQDFLKAHGVQVAIVDPAYQCVNGEHSNNVFQMGQQLKRFSDACLDIGVTPILCHHLIKNTGENFSLRDIAWAGFREWCRQWIALDRKADYVEGSGVHDLRMRWGGSVGHGGKLLLTVREGIYPNRFWELEYQTEGEALANASALQLAEDCLRVLAALQVAGEPLCKTPLRDASGISHSRFDGVLTHLLDTAKVVEAGKYRGNPTYSTPEEQQ